MMEAVGVWLHRKIVLLMQRPSTDILVTLRGGVMEKVYEVKVIGQITDHPETYQAGYKERPH